MLDKVKNAVSNISRKRIRQSNGKFNNRVIGIRDTI